jgi:hypothetical protein
LYNSIDGRFRYLHEEIKQIKLQKAELRCKNVELQRDLNHVKFQLENARLAGVDTVEMTKLKVGVQNLRRCAIRTG